MENKLNIEIFQLLSQIGNGQHTMALLNGMLNMNNMNICPVYEFGGKIHKILFIFTSPISGISFPIVQPRNLRSAIHLPQKIA